MPALQLQPAGQGGSSHQPPPTAAGGCRGSEWLVPRHIVSQTVSQTLTMCLPQCLQSEHATYVMVLPVSMIVLNVRGGVPSDSLA